MIANRPFETKIYIPLRVSSRTEHYRRQYLRDAASIIRRRRPSPPPFRSRSPSAADSNGATIQAIVGRYAPPCRALSIASPYSWVSKSRSSELRQHANLCRAAVELCSVTEHSNRRRARRRRRRSFSIICTLRIIRLTPHPSAPLYNSV